MEDGSVLEKWEPLHGDGGNGGGGGGKEKQLREARALEAGEEGSASTVENEVVLSQPTHKA
jgi:hypothetical protein